MSARAPSPPRAACLREAEAASLRRRQAGEEAAAVAALRDWLRQCFDDGATDAAITGALIAAGWQPDLLARLAPQLGAGVGGSAPRRHRMPRTFFEVTVVEEIERALKRDDIATLAALDRVRDAAGIPFDARLRTRLQREAPHVGA